MSAQPSSTQVRLSVRIKYTQLAWHYAKREYDKHVQHDNLLVPGKGRLTDQSLLMMIDMSLVKVIQHILLRIQLPH